MRLQLALNVADLAEAVDFYTRMFGVGPAKSRPGYANFAIEQPPLKLVLFEGEGASGTINHLGVETETWVHGPDGTRWEWYVKHADVVQFANVATGCGPSGGTTCCPA